MSRPPFLVRSVDSWLSLFPLFRSVFQEVDSISLASFVHLVFLSSMEATKGI